MPDEYSRAVRKDVAEHLGGAPRELRGHEPVGDGCARADFPEHAGLDREGGGGPWCDGGVVGGTGRKARLGENDEEA